MAMLRKTLAFSTNASIEIMDITALVQDFLTTSSIQDGLFIVSSPHTTLGIVINEKCEHLEKDMVRFLEKFAPPKGDYDHNRHAVDGRPNAHSHLLSLVVPSQVTVV